MRQVISDLYYEALRELENIKKTKLLISERIALEKAVTKLEAMKKVLNNCSVKANDNG